MRVLGFRAIAASCAVAILFGCSSNGAFSPGPAPGGVARTAHRGEGSLAIRIRIPRRGHHARYVSPATEGVVVGLTGAATINAAVAINSTSDCSSSSGATVCRIVVALPAGAYTARVSAFDKAPVNGVEPKTARLLSFAQNIPVTIVTGTANHFNATLSGIVSSLAITNVPNGFVGTAFATPKSFTVNAMDADGYVIVGSYSAAVTVTDTDASGATTIATSGSDNPPAGELLSSSDTVTLLYNGGPAAIATIKASATGSTSGTATFVPAIQVTLSTDTVPGTPPGTGAGSVGDLRYAMLNAIAGGKIVFNCGSPCTIVLNGPLPPVEHDLTIDGGEFGSVTIDGNHLYRVFFVDTGNVTLAHLQIQNALAQGGAGGPIPAGDYGIAGGGGAGLGAGLFVNGGTVSVVSDYFASDSVVGGAGGTGVTSGYSATTTGGGGLSGTGGGTSYENAPGGGGGVLGDGEASSSGIGGNGGLGGGGGGAGFTSGAAGGTGGAGYGSNAAGANGDMAGTANSAGGAGGFGGGGGGGLANGGAGGFGGGGGGGDNGGPGGPGGGAGGSCGGLPAAAGGALATISGGNSDDSCNGGGGAAAGPAIFVNAGVLTTSDSGAVGASASPGAAGGGGAQAGGYDTTPVFNYQGTVNNSGTRGGIASALGSTAPSAIARHPQ